jgi:hypothetical protein
MAAGGVEPPRTRGADGAGGRRRGQRRSARAGAALTGPIARGDAETVRCTSRLSAEERALYSVLARAHCGSRAGRLDRGRDRAGVPCWRRGREALHQHRPRGHRAAGARTDEPDPVRAAVLAELGGADGITVHLREDRRHIQDRDVELLMETARTG